MINIDELKKQILKAAFMGMFPCKDENDESAELLIKKLKFEKENLITQKVIKEQTSSINDTINCVIPAHWEDINICNCGYFIGGYTPSEKDINHLHGIPYFKVSDMNNPNNAIFLKETNNYVGLSNIKTFRKNTIVYPKNGGALLTNKRRILFYDSVVDLNTGGFCPFKYIDFRYVYYFFESIDLKKYSKGTSLPTLDMNKMKAIRFPLPPLEEQKRIVAKLDEIFAELDKIDEMQTSLQSIQEKMEYKILKLAIQGKLVEQRSEEGTGEELFKLIQEEKQQLIKEGKIKKEKTLPDIEKSEIPFAIPSTWKWVRLGDLGNYKKGPFGSALTKSMFVPKSEDSIKVYEQKNAIQKNWNIGTYYIEKKYYESDMKGFTLLPGDIIVSCAGTIGETYVIPNEAEIGIINQALMRMRIMKSVNIDYFLIYFDFILKGAANDKGKGTAIKNIPPFDILKNMLVPLPPFNEQKRIVAKIEELLPLCRG